MSNNLNNLLRIKRASEIAGMSADELAALYLSLGEIGAECESLQAQAEYKREMVLVEATFRFKFPDEDWDAAFEKACKS